MDIELSVFSLDSPHICFDRRPKYRKMWYNGRVKGEAL
jgi:hypothetical protein